MPIGIFLNVGPLYKHIRGKLFNYSFLCLHEISIKQVTSSLFSFSPGKLKLLKPLHARSERNSIIHSQGSPNPHPKLWWLFIQQSGPSVFTSTWGRALCLKICSCLVIIDPCYNTVPLEWTLDCPQPEESHPEPASATGHPKLPEEALSVGASLDPGAFSGFPRHHLSAHAAKFFREVLCLSWLEGQPMTEYTTTGPLSETQGGWGGLGPNSQVTESSFHTLHQKKSSLPLRMTQYLMGNTFSAPWSVLLLRSPKVISGLYFPKATKK